MYESIIVDNNVESVMLIAFAFKNVISNNFTMNYFLYDYCHGLQITQTTQGEVMPGLIGYWKQLPTKDEYIKKHNMSKISCYSCGHEKFSDVGLIQVWDNHRRILCAKCKTTLFREED